MNSEAIRRQLVSNLETHLKRGLPRHSIEEAYRYAVLPPGKLFRGLLIVALAWDHNRDGKEWENPWSDCALLASFVEIHHAYTLVHDDLPCMDDDSMRRGRPSLHKRFGQWQAVLVGDGLMGLGYHLLSFIENPRQRELLRFISWATGPKGLLQGQVLDLSEKTGWGFKNIVRTHTLKTARLIQVSLAGSALLLQENFREAFRMGHSLGLLFQFLDDLTELTRPISSHEEGINSWLHYPEESFRQSEQCLNQIEGYCLNRPALKEIVTDYGRTIGEICQDGEESIIEKVPTHCVRPLLERLSLKNKSLSQNQFV